MRNPRFAPIADSRWRLKRRLIVIGLVTSLLLAVASTAVLAANITYHSGPASANVWSVSGINNIRGGYIESCDAFCEVEIATATYFYPYYPYVLGSGWTEASISHGVYNQSRSKCRTKIFFSYGQWCYYRT